VGIRRGLRKYVSLRRWMWKEMEENGITRGYLMCILKNIQFDNQIWENYIGSACSTYSEIAHKIVVGEFEGKSHLIDVDLDRPYYDGH
jgi:hypothetical protein